MLIKLDECAVAFRKLSCFGATLAEKVATVWCGTCGMFYCNLGKLNGKDLVSYPDLYSAAADGLHHRYAERGNA